MTLFSKRMDLFPLSTQVMTNGNEKHLAIGGCDLAELADRYGTPVYVYDQYTMDEALRKYREALEEKYEGRDARDESGSTEDRAKARITYAGKAFLCGAMAQWAERNGLWIDCTGAGEIQTAVSAGVSREHILIHGVNKSAADLEAAMAHAGVIVVDNLTELRRLVEYYRTREWNKVGEDAPALWLRLRPGLSVETHAYTQTGHKDSKFGMDMQEASEAVLLCIEQGLPLQGIHFHLGSQFQDPTPIGKALEAVLDWLEEIQGQSGWTAECVSPGGGWGVAYHEDELPHPLIEDYITFLADKIKNGFRSRNLPLPKLHIEPGRSLVAQAGVALYRVGNVKKTPQRRWILVDGGMTDNPRPALYGTRYSALPVLNPERPAVGLAWIAGPFCESGDILIEGLPMPEMNPGELIAIPMSGAYHLSMSSNYNGACKPAVLWLKEGEAHLIQRREVPTDLTRRDILLPE